MAFVGILEDDAFFAGELRTKLLSVEMVSEVRIWSSAEAYLETLSRGEAIPDILFLDLKLPRMSGLDLLKQVGDATIFQSVIALTSIASEEAIFEVLRYGAVGYILKAELGDLAEILRSVLEGGAVMTPTIAIRVVDYFRKKKSALEKMRIETEEEAESVLTPRENEVLDCLVCGMSAKEAADSLGVSPHTLRVHVRNIYKKLYVTNRAELMLKARSMGRF